MPSPIAHISVAYVLFAFFRRHLPKAVTTTAGRGLLLFGLCAFFSMLPDIDAVPGFVTGNMGRYHNQWTHSLIWGLSLTAILAAVVYAVQKKNFLGCFTLFFSCYAIHIVMDYFTYGRGLRLFWPFFDARYKAEHSFFGGLRWSDGLFSHNHIWTAIEEISFGALLIGGYYALEYIGKKIKISINE